MAKAAYIGASGAARKVKKIYVGESGVAREVKKAYIGVGGVARLCYNSGVKIVSWADGTDDEIEAMIAAADAGAINLSDYWSVGDERTVSLAAMAATGVGESHVAQDVTIVLMDAQGLYTTVDGKQTSFIWGLKNGLADGTTGEPGYMNSSGTNSGGWESCARRTWCNEVFFYALPAWLQRSTKTVNVVTADGSGDSTSTSQDKCFLPAEREIGGTTYASETAEASLSQWTYFATYDNRIKRCGDSGDAQSWWLRSPRNGYGSFFCSIYVDGWYSSYYANGEFLIAPCGCI